MHSVNTVVRYAWVVITKARGTRYGLLLCWEIPAVFLQKVPTKILRFKSRVTMFLTIIGKLVFCLHEYRLISLDRFKSKSKTM